MKKLFIFPAFAFFAFVACSKDEPAPTHSELCAKKPIARECLIGRWSLDKVGGGSQCSPNKSKENSLKLEANGQFSYKGYDLSKDIEFETNGYWELNGTVMKISCNTGDCLGIDYPIDATVDVFSSGRELEITTKSYTGFSQCSVGTTSNLTEVYTWQGN